MVNVAVGAGVSQTAVEIFTTARHNHLSGSQEIVPKRELYLWNGLFLF